MRCIERFVGVGVFCALDLSLVDPGERAKFGIRNTSMGLERCMGTSRPGFGD
jgi:hypothetical protein